MTDDEKRATAKYYILYKCGFINIYTMKKNVHEKHSKINTTTLAQKG